ncbi:Periplasmic pH-dependent serine endoprotease DegQ [Oligella urethralis]|uniref:Do family serine endopeptidase n=1 Tax=Oligella urethralis TaxID=90245 RepID=UPI002958ABEC|nr:Do family serine endopeptidase [Oligella urethralis]WOS38194.1 Periplasmic pH-dependent serine endoprotease DegQ [Oligella urethralis]
MLVKKTFVSTLLAMSLFATQALAQDNKLVPSPVVKQDAPAATQAAPAVPTTTNRLVALPDFTEIVAKTETGVVNIRTMESVPVRGFSGGRFGMDQDMEEIFRFFFGPDFGFPGQRRDNDRRGPQQGDRAERQVPSSVGSGFIISEDGYIITNNHVIDKASKIIVTLNDGKELTAEVVGTDERTDLALLKVQAGGLKPLTIGGSDDLQKGQWVLAIGSPFGLDSTVTAGIVSAINRDTGDYLPFIQTDVAVNPGNSGGPLIDLSGKVVGVNSQIISRSGGFMGISLSIPINEAMKVVEQLKENGQVIRGRIGVTISEVQEDVAEAIGLANAEGALVSNVELGSPAQKAGVRAGDVITKFDGKSIKKWSDLPRLVGQTRPNTDSTIEVWRRGKAVELKITVEAVNGDAALAAKSNRESPADKSAAADRLGLTVAELSPAQQQLLGNDAGVVITDVQGAAVEAGLMVDDIILVLNDQDVRSVEQYHQLVKGLAKNKNAAILIRRDNLTQWVAVQPEK